MRLRRTLALAAAATALSLALPALVRSSPRHLPAVSVVGAEKATVKVPVAPSQAGQDQPHADHGPARTWTWPLTPSPGARRPVIVHRFALPAERWQSGHRGVDLLGGPGQEVLAAGQGTVSYAGMLFGRPVVAIDHTGIDHTAVDHTAEGRDTLRTTYEPVDPVVRVGDKVRAGQVIGHLVDSPANHCAPRTCLHWGLVRGFGHGARYLDPSALMGRGSVRLLPVWGVR
jgi:murein DD-endopeptidase MepM/ murein hydrolase activator NlpD